MTELWHRICWIPFLLMVSCLTPLNKKNLLSREFTERNFLLIRGENYINGILSSFNILKIGEKPYNTQNWMEKSNQKTLYATQFYPMNKRVHTWKIILACGSSFVLVTVFLRTLERWKMFLSNNARGLLIR